LHVDAYVGNTLVVVSEQSESWGLKSYFGDRYENVSFVWTTIEYLKDGFLSDKISHNAHDIAYTGHSLTPHPAISAYAHNV